MFLDVDMLLYEGFTTVQYDKGARVVKHSFRFIHIRQLLGLNLYGSTYIN